MKFAQRRSHEAPNRLVGGENATAARWCYSNVENVDITVCEVFRLPPICGATERVRGLPDMLRRNAQPAATVLKRGRQVSPLTNRLLGSGFREPPLQGS